MSNGLRIRTMESILYDDIALDTVQYANYHDAIGSWKDKSLWFWYWNTVEETIELGLSLIKLHRHPPAMELRQIASIAINFQRYLARREK